MDQTDNVTWATLRGFVGGLIGALIAGLALLWLGFYGSQPIAITVTLVGAAVGTAVGFGLTERMGVT